MKLEGTDELIRNLQKALTKHKPNEVRKVLRRGGKVLVDAAKSNVRVNDGGKLKRSIKILPKWRKDPASIFVAPRVLKRITKRTSQKSIDKNPFYAHWVEYGTRPHDNSYQGKFVSDAKPRQHPGARKMPYMRPAFDSAGQHALDTAIQDLKKMIESGSK